jgi:hypothetical protein
MFEEKVVCFSHSAGLLSLVGVPIVVGQADFPGIHVAARNLAADFARVTKGPPPPLQIVTNEHDEFASDSDSAIIVGSIVANPIIQCLEKNGKIHLGSIRGKWESYTTTVVKNPFTGCRRALVIAGSDKRGAIFGVYALSEQIGVSPYGILCASNKYIFHCRLTVK